MTRKFASLIGLAGIAVGLLGCAAQQTEYLVKLKYRKEGEIRLPALSQASPLVVLTPFTDLRREARGFGVYRSIRQTVFLVSAKGTAAEAITEMAQIFFERAGFRHVLGNWDGEVETLQDIEGDYAVFGEILALDFSSSSTFNYQKNRGAIILRIRMGNRAERRVVSRTIEVSADKLDFRLLKNQLEHLMKLEKEIQRAVNKALQEGFSDLIMKVGS